MQTEAEKHDDIIELGAASAVTLGFVGGPLEAFAIPDRQDRPT